MRDTLEKPNDFCHNKVAYSELRIGRGGTSGEFFAKGSCSRAKGRDRAEPRRNKERSMAARKRRPGFTLVELLVVISIISMLMALLLPAVQRAREAGRRATCFNNEHQLSVALISYENAKGHYPGYANAMSNVTGATKTSDGTPINASWCLLLTPYIERSDIYRLLGPSGYPESAAGAAPRLNLFVCPSNPPESTTGGARTAYVVNAGTPDWVTDNSRPPDVSGNGLFHYRGWVKEQADKAWHIAQGPQVSASWLSSRDGVSTTLMLAENVNAGFWYEWVEPNVTMVWTPKVDITNRPKTDYAGYAINVNKGNGTPIELGADENPWLSPQKWLARPSSFHPGGAVASFADGHQKFLSEDMTYWVFIQLMTPAGEEAWDMDEYNQSSQTNTNYIRQNIPLLSDGDY